jgi:hypothetical protein
VGNYRSAIKDFYKQKHIDFPASTNAFLNDFMNGYCRKVAGLKQVGEMALVEESLTQNMFFQIR